MKEFIQKISRTQAFWVTVSVILLTLAMSAGTASFGSGDNLYNITRNLAFIGLLALGQNAVIITGGIDLSVGSVMGLSGIACALSLSNGAPLWLGVLTGLGAAAVCGVINGTLVAYVRLSSFVVTLGMMSIARSIAMVVSNNRTLFQMGPDEELFLSLGSHSFAGLSTPLLTLLGCALVVGTLFRASRWGQHLYAIGGNEEAARLTGIRVDRMKLSAYLLSSLMAGLTGILTVAWMGSASNALGSGYELQAIAASVIGGAQLTGGEGGAYGAIIGAALIEVIRNSLLLSGMDPYWQGTFVGAFIILAVLLEAIRRRLSGE